MYFIKHHLIGVTDAPESGNKCQNCGQREGGPVIALEIGSILLRCGFGKLVELNLRRNVAQVGLFRPGISLPQATLRRLATSHDSTIPNCPRLAAAKRLIRRELREIFAPES
jgi:hypothetical protein